MASYNSKRKPIIILIQYSKYSAGVLLLLLINDRKQKKLMNVCYIVLRNMALKLSNKANEALIKRISYR